MRKSFWTLARIYLSSGKKRSNPFPHNRKKIASLSLRNHSAFSVRNTIVFLLCCVQFILSQTYIVKFKACAADSAAVSSLLRQSFPKKQSLVNAVPSFSIKQLSIAHLSGKSKFPWEQYATVNFKNPLDQQTIQAIGSNPSVEYMQPIYNYHVYAVPDDSAYSSQWNLNRIGINHLYESGIINPALPDVIVGIVDTGIKEDHPDLINAIAHNSGEIGIDAFGNDKRTNGIDDDSNGFIDDWQGYDFVDLSDEDGGDWSNRDNDPTDENGHGTSVAGIIGAQTNNGIGLSGIAPCKILPLRAFGKNGNGIDIDIASAIVYAVDNGAELVNMSFGDVVQSPILHDAIQYAYSNHVVLIASSGNDGSNYAHYPSDFSEVISTGSVNQYDSRSMFSSHSPSLDITAPGEQIVTTTFTGGYINTFSGTSAAAPHVSGVAALMKSIEHQKRNSSISYVPLSNEEIRGILLNSADDAGEKGWDEFYGAGIVNAEKALQAVSGSTVTIHSPKLDDILSSNFTDIIVTVSTPYLKSVQLYYGRGEAPAEWIGIAEIQNKILVNDTIRFLNNISLPDDVYILRLVARNSKGNDAEYRQRVYIARSTPAIISLNFRDSIIVGNEYGALIEARIDRYCYGNLYFRKTGETNYSRLQSIGLQKNHTFLLTAKNFVTKVQYQVYCEFVENSPLKRSVKFYLTDSIGSPLQISSQTISTTGLIKKPYSLPSGFLLNSVQPIAGKPTIILNEYDAGGNFGKLKAFEFSGNTFVVKDSSTRSWVPRRFIHNDEIAAPSILVQDRGISQLLRVDAVNGKFFNQPVWGDSTDVWASNIVDLDGDSKPEIIARSSSEYLIYKNLGNSNFSLETHLPNPTSPLTGEGKNQFGTPKAIVGEFTNSGRKEIIFADYDGDVLLYRQNVTNSLDFSLIGVDTSDLYEMSDFITTGDFNGDGILDFAVAGHSNLDWNIDREYDAPVWTVRVFSHLPVNSAGEVTKIWEQYFVGVKAGIGYDNGLISGKLSGFDTKDALFISFNPYLYIFEWNNNTKTFESKWVHSSQSNSVIMFDFDGDNVADLGFHTNNKTEFWSLASATRSTQSPWNISVKPIAATKILMQWNSSSQTHNIYRGSHPDSLATVASVNGTEWIDSTVAINTKYIYAVTAINVSESQKSSLVSILPHTAPTITNVSQSSVNQVSIELSFEALSENLLGTQFLLDNSDVSSSVVWKSTRNLLATFTVPIIAGNHSLKIQRLVDESGMEGDTSAVFSFSSSYQPAKEFFVRSVVLLSHNIISIEFSEPPELSLALNSANYSVKTIAKNFTVASVTPDSTNSTTVRLHFPPSVNLSELALRLEVKVSQNVTSLAGVRLLEGKGQVLSIEQETESIENIVIYPNPVKNSQSVSFVNIPSNCRITVFSANGEKIKKFDDATTSEGISWNLKDEKGNALSSGIYLYRVEKLDNAGNVAQTHLGKFAVVK